MAENREKLPTRYHRFLTNSVLTLDKIVLPEIDKEKSILHVARWYILDDRMIMSSGSNWFSEAVDDLLLISFGN